MAKGNKCFNTAPLVIGGFAITIALIMIGSAVLFLLMIVVGLAKAVF